MEMTRAALYRQRYRAKYSSDEIKSKLNTLKLELDKNQLEVSLPLSVLCEDKVDYRYPYTPDPPASRGLTYIPSRQAPGEITNRPIKRAQEKSLSESIRDYLAVLAWGDVYIVTEASMSFNPFLPVKKQLWAVENGEACRPFEFPALDVLVFPHMGGQEVHLTDKSKRAIAPQAIDDRWGTSISRHFPQCSLGNYCQPFAIMQTIKSGMPCLTSILIELSVYEFQAANNVQKLTSERLD